VLLLRQTDVRGACGQDREHRTHAEKDMNKASAHTLIDDLMNAYQGWCEASAAVDSAYQRWSIASSPDAAEAFAAYVAALDREERASAEYARLFARGRFARARELWAEERQDEAA
jgi:hypothetical protein